MLLPYILQFLLAYHSALFKIMCDVCARINLYVFTPIHVHVGDDVKSLIKLVIVQIYIFIDIL